MIEILRHRSWGVETLDTIRDKLSLGDEVRLLHPRDVFITKGTEVYVQAIVPVRSFSLAGVQPKFAVRSVELTGIVAHVRGDAPTAEASTKIGVWIVPSDLGAATKLFDNLTVEIARCPDCGHVEVGPLLIGTIKAVIERH